VVRRQVHHLSYVVQATERSRGIAPVVGSESATPTPRSARRPVTTGANVRGESKGCFLPHTVWISYRSGQPRQESSTVFHRTVAASLIPGRGLRDGAGKCEHVYVSCGHGCTICGHDYAG